MNRKINFICIIILLGFAICFSLATSAQDKWRLTRPADTSQSNQYNEQNQQGDQNQQNNEYPPYAPSRTSNVNDQSAFRINIPANHLNGSSTKSSATINGGINRDNSLTQIQLQKLAAHDIVLLIDKSGSMATADCPMDGNSKLKTILPNLLFGSNPFANTRWQWCRQQIAQMSELTQDALPSGFSVLLFDSGYYLFPHVTKDTLPRIFQNNRPGGGTNLTQPLSAVFNDYFKRQKFSRVKIKPLLIGVITDGCPNDPEEVRHLIANLTHSLQNPREISIIFFLIGGHDSEGEKFVRNLTEKALRDGAAFNIVKAIPFSQVQSAGLVRTLADNLD